MFIMAYMHVKFEIVIANIFATIDLNTNLHLTLKQEMSKVMVKEKQGMQWIELINVYMHVKFERVIICSYL